jgi:LysM repeat protein
MKKVKRFFQVIVCSLLMASLFYFANGSANATGNYITVQKGDTLYRISKQYHLTVQELKAYNDLKNDKIYTGQKLYIPNLDQSKTMFVVNAGSFTTKTNAEKRVSFLKKRGIDAIIVQKIIKEKSHYRVQAGVYSSKNNAEKQQKALKKIGIKDAYILTENPLQINGITIGATYNQLIHHFGKPAKIEDQSNIKSLYYQNDGAGVQVKFNMANGIIDQLQVYPDFIKSSSIPNEKKEILDVYGYPNDVKIVSCYESAKCEQLIFQFNQNQLTVQIDRDGKSVQYLDLKRTE